MEITWLGHSCFELKNDNATIITDPYDRYLGLTMPPVEADVVTFSYTDGRPDSTLNKVSGPGGKYRVLDRPGEYEIKDIFMIAHAIYPPRARRQKEIRTDTPAPLETVHKTVFIYQLDDIQICHLGRLNHVPVQAEIEDLENIDVLLVPVGGNDTLNAVRAAEVISIIEPPVVIPMAYALPGVDSPLDPLDKFLNEMGRGPGGDPQPRLRLSPSTLPPETQVFVLEARCEY